MTDAEAKKCLERIVNINEKVNGISNNKKDWGGVFPLAFGLLLSIVTHFIGRLILYSDGNGILSDLFGTIIGFILTYFSIPLIAICGIGTIVILISCERERNSYGGSQKMDEVYQELIEERQQLIDMLKQSFPNAKVVPSTYNSHTKRILEKMNEGEGYLSACASLQIDYRIEKDERDYERMFEREQAAKSYKQAVLNEQRRTNENLENLQRQQEYANRLAREEEYRRNYEDLKEKVNRKWGE